MTDRIADIRAEAEKAIAAAADTHALENVRIQYLGRKAELPNLLRDVAELPAARARRHRQGRQRGAQGARGGDRAARRATRRAGARAAARARPRRHHAPGGSRPGRLGRLHLITQTRREIEDVFIGLGFNVAEGPEVETVYYNFDALNFDSTHPSRLMSDTFYVEPTPDIFDPQARAAARAHLAGADPRDGAPAAAALHRRPGAHVPPRQRRHPHAPVPPDRGARGRHRHHARRPPGDAAAVRARDLRRGARGPPATRTSSRSPSRASRSMCRASTAMQGVTADGQRCPLCKGTAWIEILGVRDGRPERVRVRPRLRIRPRARSRGSRSGWGSSGSRCSSTASPTCGLLYDNDVRFLEQFG